MARYTQSLLSGLLGAVVVTALNEGVRRFYHKAPRLEKLGMDTSEKVLDAAGLATPAREPLYWGTFAADLASNALYYSVIGLARKNKGLMWGLGAGLGLAAGAGAVLLPEPLELDSATTSRSLPTKLLTVAWYLGGALVATGIASAFFKKEHNR